MAQAQNTSHDAVSGLQPLPYLNQNQPATVLFVRQKRAPTPQDRRFKFGTLWLDTAANIVYALVSVTNNAAFWSLLGAGSGEVDTLTGDTGGAIGPTLGNINILGGDGLTVSGAGNTLTVDRENKTGYSAYLYVVGKTGEAGYQTVQAAIDAVVADGGDGQIFLQPGTYTENLVFGATMNVGLITGTDEDASAAHIIGEHTPPISGNLVIWRIKMTSSQHIFNSTAAGTSNLVSVHNNYSVNGYIWNIPNWTGSVAAGLIADRSSASSGIINNSGGSAAVFLFSSDLGVGSANPGSINGFCEIQQCGIGCPITYGGAIPLTLGRNIITAEQTITGTVPAQIINSYFSTGASPALTYSSGGDSVISDCTINSSNNPAVAGGGAGSLSIGTLSFISNSDLDPALTLVRGASTTGTVKAIDLVADTAGGGLKIKEGANARMGTAILTAGSITIANTSVTANTRIFLTPQSDGGTPGFVRITAKIPSTSFTITSSSGADTSTIGWNLIEPA